MTDAARDTFDATEALDAIAQERGGDAAIERARELLADALHAWPATLRAADACNQVGAFLSKRKFDAEARSAFRRAMALLKRSGTADDKLRAQIHNNLGQLDMHAGKTAPAVSHLELALHLQRRAGGNPIEIAFVSDNLGSALHERGELDRAEALHLESLGILEAAGNRWRADVATVLGNLGQLYAARGESSRAKATLLRALDTHLRVHAIEDGDAWTPLVALIDLLVDQGEEDEADPLVDILLRAGGAEPAVRHHRLAVAMLELARTAYSRFRLALAERLLVRANLIFERSVGAMAESTLEGLEMLNNVRAARGNHEAALEGQARLLKRVRDDDLRGPRLLTAMGKSLRLPGPASFGAAQAMFESAIAQLRAASRGPAQRSELASALGNLGQLRFEQDQLADAASLYDEALALLDAPPPDGERAWLQFNRGLLHYHVGQFDAARELLKEAMRTWASLHGDRHPHVGTAANNLALVEWSTGDLPAARTWFAQANAIHAPMFQRDLMIGSERARTLAARQHLNDVFCQVSFCLASGAGPEASEQAATLLLQRKAAVLDALAINHQRLRRTLDPGASVNLDRLQQVRSRIAAHTLEARVQGRDAPPRQLAVLQAEEDALQEMLSHAGTIGLGVGALPTLEAVRAAIPPGVVLIEYVRYTVFDPHRTGRGTPWRDQRYAGVVLRAQEPPSWRDLGDAAAIDAAVDGLRQRVADPDSGDAWRDAALRLRQHVLAPFEAQLGEGDTLLIAPDGALALAPFALLADRWPVQHVNCGRELLRRRTSAGNSPPVVVLADPDFDADVGEGAVMPDAPQLEPLPASRAEAALIASLFEGATVHTGAAATADALRDVTAPAILHVATHGLFDAVGDARPLWHEQMLPSDRGLLFLQHAVPTVADNPMLHAWLALAGANRSGASALVSAAEVALLDLRGTELVVLSACETGLGASGHGAEFAGLRRALSIAGAARQLITLWSIEDRASAVFIAALYRALVKGEAPALALRSAQQAVRDHPGWAHPVYWAAFASWGDLTPLSPTLRSRAKLS
jgi:CHAT domain-containing protein/Tfp pilus assembly protein PilF